MIPSAAGKRDCLAQLNGSEVVQDIIVDNSRISQTARQLFEFISAWTGVLRMTYNVQCTIPCQVRASLIHNGIVGALILLSTAVTVEFRRWLSTCTR